MKNLVEEAFSYNYLLLRLYGLVPFKNYEKYHTIYFSFIFITVTVLLPVLSFASFFLEQNDLDVILQSAFITCQFFIMIWKYIVFYIYRRKTIALIDSLNNEIFSNNYKPRQEHILNEGIVISKRCCLFFLAHVVMASPPFAAAPLLLKTGRTPLDIWTPYEKPVGSTEYVISYIYVATASIMTAFSIAGYDTLAACLMYQMTCQIRILKDNLVNLDKDAEQQIIEEYGKLNKGFNRLKSEIIFKNFQKYVHHHQMIIRFIDDYVEYFSLSTFLQFVGSCLVICTSIYVISITKSILSFTFMFSIIYTAAMFLIVFLYCFFGATLWEESSSIATAIYMCNWYTFNLKCRKSLMILMERSNKPLIATAGGIIDLSLDSFTMVIRRAYSFYAVLSRYKN